MVLSPELLKDCEAKAHVDVVDHPHHAIWIWTSWRNDSERLPRLPKPCADEREDVISILPTHFIVRKCWCTQSNTNLKESYTIATQIHISKLSMVIYWFHVPNIDSYSFYSPYLFIFE